MPRPKRSDAQEIILPLSDQDPFPFGIWEGTPMCEVPAAYLVGAYQDGVFDSHPLVKKYVAKRLNALKAEIEANKNNPSDESEE